MNQRRTKEWKNAWAKLKKEFERKGITSCEVRLDGCLGTLMLTPAHRHKRRKYYGTGMVGDFSQVVIACVKCHDKMEQDKELSEQVFERLRGVDTL